ncbi:MAG: right-handed parallel beta-helix repeat-containing protein [Thermoanaerobaculales bacterium]|nr:right-handed parallel beta-helix repeat-containing protein [Thermoanaerobaculales bacterium]
MRSAVFRGMSIAVVVMVVLGATAVVSAGEGVMEINQTVVEQGLPPCSYLGAGFPCDINSSGSYVLTGDLVAPDQNTDVIVVRSDNVTIDLNGFSIIGPNDCTLNDTVIECTAVGGGVGILSSIGDNITVRNGTIRGTGDSAIALQDRTTVENIQVRDAGSEAIIVGSDSHVVSCTVTEVKGSAVYLFGSNAVVRDCQVSIIDKVGVYVELEGATITGNTIMRTGFFAGGEGIYVAGSATVVGNTVHRSGGHGIVVGANGLVRGNVVYNAQNSGIVFGGMGSAIDNMVSICDEYGITFSAAGGAFGGNTIDGNLLGPVYVTGPGAVVELSTNACDGGIMCLGP